MTVKIFRSTIEDANLAYKDALRKGTSLDLAFLVRTQFTVLVFWATL